MTLDRLRTSGFAGTLVEGDAAEPSVLRRASVTKATVVVSAVREDRENLMVSLVAQKLVGAREVLARASDPERAAMYHDLGLTVICPTVIGGEAILDLAGVERVRAGSAG